MQKLTVGDDGTQTVELGGLAPGVYRVTGKATIASRQVDASDIFLVRENGSELDRPVGDRATLEAIAAATHGSGAGPGRLATCRT